MKKRKLANTATLKEDRIKGQVGLMPFNSEKKESVK
jgi:hypothetical protein